MGLSIQEQLLKAGMVDKKQVKKAQHEKRIQSKKKQRGGTAGLDSTNTKFPQQQAEQAKKDQQLNAQRNLLAQQKADHAAAKQLIETNRLPVEEGTVGYHYVEAGQIKRIFVTQDIADKLSAGKIGLAMFKSDFVLLTVETVSKILTRDKDLILAYNDPADIEDEYPSDW